MDQEAEEVVVGIDPQVVQHGVALARAGAGRGPRRVLGVGMEVEGQEQRVHREQGQPQGQHASPWAEPSHATNVDGRLTGCKQRRAAAG